MLCRFLCGCCHPNQAPFVSSTMQCKVLISPPNICRYQKLQWPELIFVHSRGQPTVHEEDEAVDKSLSLSSLLKRLLLLSVPPFAVKLFDLIVTLHLVQLTKETHVFTPSLALQSRQSYFFALSNKWPDSWRAAVSILERERERERERASRLA